MAKMGRIHLGRPLTIKSRKALLETIKPHQYRYLRPDTGDMPDGWEPAPRERELIALMPSAVM
jgi:hypothetical protein